mmetsp:Transcript_22155/g.36706  ORF Transcript_22155/g.36706 Transcript_22155/m.36706 type:complete len:480 (-) Transcript_22155:353-1792(-)|eukprot:CAMPEP_0184662390 /NCGR_PEP_ID=MMETSP0308-20130426/43044_1 /TAXON_ID=38269 /ORGANISM="Gloeochaete witrockiana, Strain SAG 46.84" /LENGTH=479 /DNA_ID=CAMNT_0027104395 /DNA_START=226 /DNA_END=1665 /DNA_ORIENTATION=-
MAIVRVLLAFCVVCSLAGAAHASSAPVRGFEQSFRHGRELAMFSDDDRSSFGFIMQAIIRFLGAEKDNGQYVSVARVRLARPMSPGGTFTRGGYTVHADVLSFAVANLAVGLRKYAAGFQNASVYSSSFAFLESSANYIDNNMWQRRSTDKLFMHQVGDSTGHQLQWGLSYGDLRGLPADQLRPVLELNNTSPAIAFDVSSGMAATSKLLGTTPRLRFIKHAGEMLTYGAMTPLSYSAGRAVFGDEMVFAAIHRAYAENTIGSPLREWPGKAAIGDMRVHPIIFSRSEKSLGCLVLLSMDWFKDYYRTRDNFAGQASNWFTAILAGRQGVRFTSGGLIYVPGHSNVHGSLHVAVFTALASYLYVDFGMDNQTSLQAQQLVRFADTQIAYIMGQNPLGRCYVYGISANSVTKLYHRFAYNPSSWILLPTLSGALVGGPLDGTDAFIDDGSNPVANGVSVDSAVALLICLARQLWAAAQSR